MSRKKITNKPVARNTVLTKKRKAWFGILNPQLPAVSPRWVISPLGVSLLHHRTREHHMPIYCGCATNTAGARCVIKQISD